MDRDNVHCYALNEENIKQMKQIFVAFADIQRFAFLFYGKKREFFEWLFIGGVRII